MGIYKRFVVMCAATTARNFVKTSSSPEWENFELVVLSCYDKPEVFVVSRRNGYMEVSVL